jgi:hypothetical protein
MNRLAYSEESPSRLVWVNRGVPAGWLNENGYWLVNIDKKMVRVHRVIWELLYGAIPPGFDIDHINGIRSDNRAENLRLADRTHNNANKSAQSNNLSSGVKGVARNRGNWMGHVTYRGKRYSATFPSIDEAAKWRQAKSRALFGEFHHD